MLWGSPPRVRGTGDESGEAGRDSGITPACAGNSGIFLFPALVS